MTENELAPGTPMWVDLGTPDVAASKRFYTGIFGWTADEAGPEYGGYVTFSSNGKPVAGAAPLMNPGQPPAWGSYVKVTDADATAAKAREAGGQVLVEPMDVGDQGRMAILQDPPGAVIGLWQPAAMGGAGMYNVPVSLSWNELSTRDVEGSKPFYRAVFGWDARTSGEGPQQYTEWLLDGRSIAGMMAMPEQMPAEVPPHWLVYFAVADIQEVVRKTSELGGQVRMPAMTIPQGTFAVLADPSGATFAAIQLNA